MKRYRHDYQWVNEHPEGEFVKYEDIKHLLTDEPKKQNITSQYAKLPSFEDVLNECYVPSVSYTALFKGVYDAVKKLGNFA
jgi:hypothetical protein